MFPRKNLPPLRFILFLLLALLSLKFPVAGLLVLSFAFALKFPFLKLAAGRLIIGFLLGLALNALLYEIFNIAGLRPSISLIGALYSLMGSWLMDRYYSEINKLTAFKIPDLAAIVVILFSLGLLIYPVGINNSFPSHSERTLHILSAGEDNASHFALFKYAYLHDGYAYRKNVSGTGLINTLVNYPQASEFNNAWMAKGLLGKSYAGTNTVLLMAFYGLNSLIFSLLAGLTVLVPLEIYVAGRKKIIFFGASIAALAAIAALVLSPVLELFGRGFHSQIAALLFMTGMIYLLLCSAAQARYKQFILLSSFVLFSGVCLCWWFLAPVAIIPFVIYAWQNRSHILNFAMTWKTAATFFVLAVLIFYPIILNYVSGTTSSFINEKGGADKIAAQTVCIYLAALAVPFLLMKSERKRFTALLSCAVAWALFTATVGLYQKVTIGHFEYYYYKSLYTVIPLAVISLIYAALSLAGRLNLKGIYKETVYSFLCIGFFVITLLGVKPLYPRVYIHDWFNNPMSASVLDKLLAKQPGGSDNRSFFIGGCSPGTMYTADRWEGAFSLSEDSWSSKIELATLKNNPAQIVSALSRAPNSTQSVRLYMSPTCIDPKVAQFIGTNEFSTDNLD